MQRQCIALERDAAERGKPRGIGPRDAEWIADACRLWPEHRMRKYRLERGLHRQRGLRRKLLQRQAESRRRVEFTFQRRVAFLVAIDLEPAVLAQIFRAAGFGEQRLVLGDGAGKERADYPCVLG